jgi:hypothetical protein
MPNHSVKTVRSIAFTVVFLSTAVHASAQERYVRASVAKVGALHIVTATGGVIVPSLEPEREFIGKQVGFDHIQIASDQLAVGWVALFPNCCTSYPIPLALVIYSGGIKRTYTGNGLPIWKWRFIAKGNQVAFRQETVHGGLGVHYELRNVRNGALIAQYRPAVGPDNQPLPNQQVPDWVASLDANQ